MNNKSDNKKHKYIYIRARACATWRAGYARSSGLIISLGLFVLAATWLYGADSVDSLIRQLKSENNFARKSAAAKLGVLKDSKAVQPLIKALKDKDPEVRGQAADSLGLLRDSKAVKDLSRLLESDTNQDVKKRASIALSQFSGPEVESHFLSCFDQTDQGVLFGCIQAVSEKRIKKAIPQLVKIYQTKKGKLQYASLLAISEIGFAGNIKIFLSDLNSSNYSLKSGAIRVLGTSGKKEAIAPLKRRLSDPNPGIRVLVSKALAQLSDASGQKNAVDLLFHPNAGIRADVAKTLGLIKEKNTKKILIAALNREKDPVVKKNLQFAVQGIRQK